MTPLTGLRDAMRYEAFRVASTRSSRRAVVLALLGAALVTLPSARGALAAAGSARFAAGPTGAAAHVVAGGIIGLVLPGTAAAAAAAWVGASAVVDEYRRGSAQLTYVLLPRRSTVLLAKSLVSALFGVLLSFATAAAAFGTARLGFAVASSAVEVPSGLVLPGPLAAATAALAGAVGVLAAVTLRLRLVAMVVALCCCAGMVAALRVSSKAAAFAAGERPSAIRAAADPLSGYARVAASSMSHAATSVGLPPGAVPVSAVPAALLALLFGAALCAVRRRRTW